VCGRYELHTHPAALALMFGLPIPPTLPPRYNIAPMQDVPVIRTSPTGERELSMVRWGLVPRWAKDPGIGSKMINARAETLAEKPSFRTALKKHRCLIPANGFYEWKVVAGGAKQPLHIGMKDGAPFAFAGLTERWLSPAGEVLDTCTIITTQANALLSPMHDRMPAIVPPAAYARWLDVAIGDVADILAPYPAAAMMYYPVSTRVNAVRHDDPSLIERVEEAGAAEALSNTHVEHEPARGVPPEQSELF
jgi:putative SOS response-associated peptidase YedK